jgi:hypothetical protein
LVRLHRAGAISGPDDPVFFATLLRDYRPEQIERATTLVGPSTGAPPGARFQALQRPSV